MGLWDGTDVPTREQFDYWQDVICREFVPLSAVKTGEITGFASKVETSALGSLNRASIMSKAQITRRSSREIAVSDQAYFFVNLQLAGQCLARVGGTCSVVAPGDFMVVDTTEPYEFEFKGDWRMLSFRVQHASLAHRLAAFRSRLGTSIGSTGAGAAVTSLMTSLSSLPDDLPPASAEALVQAFESAVIGTLAAAPGPAGDAIGTTPPAGRRHGIREAELRGSGPGCRPRQPRILDFPAHPAHSFRGHRHLLREAGQAASAPARVRRALGSLLPAVRDRAGPDLRILRPQFLLQGVSAALRCESP